MDLPGSACAPRFTYISIAFGCHTISSDYQSRTAVWTHSTWTYHWGLERSCHFDTTWSSPFQQNYEDISHTFRCTFGEYFWMVGWQKKNQKPVLPLYLRLDIPSNLSRALPCLRLSGHNFLVQRMRHDRNRRPYELRICDRCDWHTIIQDEEHILLDCPHEHLVRLRTQQQLIFPPQFEDSPTLLRTFLNQPEICGVASMVAECLALFPWFVRISFWFGFRLFPSFRSDAPQRHI